MNKTIRIETLIDRTVECMLALGLSPNSVYGGLYGRLEAVRRYYCKHNEEYYSPALMEQFLQELNQRYAAKEIHKSHYLKLRKSAERIMEVYETGTLTWSMRKPKAKYMVSNEDSVLLDEFLQWGAFHWNTGNDYSWVVRRYLTYLHNQGIQNISEVQNTDIASFILSCAKEVSRGSLRNILSYTKKFHFFLRETGRLDIPFEGIFTVSIIRESKIQQPLTTAELNAVLAQIDLNSASGKRNYAIILLGSELGLRACDITNMKLTDIDWLRNEIHIHQQKTGYPVNLPLTEQAASALREYILNCRPKNGCEYVFLKLSPPYMKITDSCSIGEMFAKYQKAAGIERKPFDGKGFHSLRRRLGKALVVEGVPVTTISQILGHRDMDTAKQYMSLDSVHLKDCALDFSSIGGAKRG